MGIRGPAPRGRRVYRGHRRRRGRSGAPWRPREGPPASARRRRGPARRAVAETEALDVAERRPGVAVDEDGAGGAARERLDRQGAGAAVEVEDGGAGDPLAQGGEDRLADAVGGRAHLPAARRDQALPPQLPGDHPHAGPIDGCRLSPTGLQVAPRRFRGGSGRRRRRRSGDGPPRAEGRGRERSSEPWRRSRASDLPAGLGQERAVLGQRGDGEARQAALAGAEDLALAPRSSRSTSASLKPSRSPATASSRRRASSPAASANSRHWEGCSPRPTRPRSWCSWETPKRSAPSITITVALATSIPTSITVVATSTSVSPAAKARIASALSAEGIWPWRTPTSKPRSSPARSRRASTSAALPCDLLGLLDQRADDEGLAPLAQPARGGTRRRRRGAPRRPARSRPAPGRRAARAARSCRGRRRR